MFCIKVFDQKIEIIVVSFSSCFSSCKRIDNNKEIFVTCITYTLVFNFMIYVMFDQYFVLVWNRIIYNHWVSFRCNCILGEMFLLHEIRRLHTISWSIGSYEKLLSMEDSFMANTLKNCFSSLINKNSSSESPKKYM